MSGRRNGWAVVLLCGLVMAPAGVETVWGQYTGNRLGDRSSRLGTSQLSRETGAIYLEDILDQPIKLKVLRATNVYLQLDGKRSVGMLIPGREVELLGISEKAYRVRGQAKHAQVAGWVRPSDLGGASPTLKENLEKLYERALLVEDLISKKQVALGMTMSEVARAMGEPTRTSSTLDKEGRKDSYEYVTYKKVPVNGPLTTNQYGQVYSSVYYVKVEAGKVTINFEDEMVTSIEESEGTPPGAVVRTVPRPVVFY